MKRGKKIAFVNNKGGVGKTTLTTNYGVILAKKGYKVLIIDTDAQTNVIHCFGAKAKEWNASQKQYPTLYEVTFRNANLTDAIMNVDENLRIIDCGKNWRYADVEMMNTMISGGSYRLFENILNELEKKLWLHFNWYRT
ncbi:hypothetical protein CEG41_00710 [Ureaplasma parvum]|uniref:AAA family ATPase n=1 Tax=Ureaplasma parvum TaxID=134821 RepID=UPI000B4C937E|nr:AAA family ATPase [Ureaplasma parvum]ASD29225.1 hypothetical protein CEG41_00710 [Ureaplasma parvum]